MLQHDSSAVALKRVATFHAQSMAGLDKHLSSTELQIIADTYTVPRGPSLIMTDYKTFLNDVEIVFTLPVSRKGAWQPLSQRGKACSSALCA